jgi:hypothetical protein
VERFLAIPVSGWVAIRVRVLREVSARSGQAGAARLAA